MISSTLPTSDEENLAKSGFRQSSVFTQHLVYSKSPLRAKVVYLKADTRSTPFIMGQTMSRVGKYYLWFAVCHVLYKVARIKYNSLKNDAILAHLPFVDVDISAQVKNRKRRHVKSFYICIICVSVCGYSPPCLFTHTVKTIFFLSLVLFLPCLFYSSRRHDFRIEMLSNNKKDLVVYEKGPVPVLLCARGDAVKQMLTDSKYPPPPLHSTVRTCAHLCALLRSNFEV